jgi:hypothetical protein
MIADLILDFIRTSYQVEVRLDLGVGRSRWDLGAIENIVFFDKLLTLLLPPFVSSFDGGLVFLKGGFEQAVYFSFGDRDRLS